MTHIVQPPDSATICVTRTLDDPPFTLNDPQNATEARVLAVLAHGYAGALFFLTIIKPDGTTWAVPFVAADKPRTIDDKTIGGLPEMLALAKRETIHGHNIFITTNSFTRPFYKKEGRQKAFRKAENMRASRTLVADLDVKQGAYESREEALTDLGRVVEETGLPKPTIIVNSGRGVHAWWCLDRVLPSSEWLALAPRFAALFEKHGLKFDHQCTSNPAGILRLVGTANSKQGKLRPVRLDSITNPPHCSADAIIRVIESFSTARQKALARSMLGSIGNFTAGVGDSAPPADLDAVALKCPMLADTLTTGGLGHAEPQWRLDLLLAHFSTDPLGNAVRLSNGDPRFVLEDTMEKLATIERQQAETDFGWPACVTFAKYSPHCAACPHRDEGRSPLYFGLRADQPGEDPAPPQGGDWLGDACRRFGVIAAGRYHGRVLPRDIRAFTTAKTSGVSFLVGIVDGPYAGYECRIGLACDGTLDSVIRRDIGILTHWAARLAVGPTSDPVALIKALGAAGENCNITFDLGIDAWAGARTLFLKAVEVDDDG